MSSFVVAESAISEFLKAVLLFTVLIPQYIFIFLTSVAHPVLFCHVHFFYSDCLIDLAVALYCHRAYLYSGRDAPSSDTYIENVVGHTVFRLLPGWPSTSDAVSTSATWMFSVRLSMFSTDRLSAANLPPTVASNRSATFRAFRFSRLNFSLEPRLR